VANRTVAVTLKAEVSRFVGGMKTAVGSARDLNGEVSRMAKDSPQRLNDLAMAAAGLGVALLGVAGYAVRAAAAFDKEMSQVRAVAQGSAADMAKLRQAALDAGKATEFTATQAAQAQAELAKAGVSTADILGGALSGSLALAAAGSLDLAKAAEIAAKAMNVFQLNGAAMPHIADVLAAAANKSATDVHQLGEALKQGGLAAKASGLSLEETVGTLAAFSDRALDGSDAGTSLKTMLMVLAAPSKEAAELMEALGISVYDANGQFIGTTKLAGVLQRQLAGLTQQQRNSALATIFGSDAMRAANVLFEVGENGIRDYVSAVDDQGAAAETAAKKTDNLAGDIERLTGSLETLAIEAGSGANGGLRALVQALNGVVDAFASLPGPVQSSLVILAGVGGTSLLAAAGLMKARVTAVEALTALREMGPAGERAALGLGKLSRVLLVAGAWGLAAVAAYKGVQMFLGYLNRHFEPAKRDVDGMTRAMREFADTGRATGELSKLFGANLELLGDKFEAIEESASRLREGLSDSGDALDQLGRGMAQAGAEAAGLNDKFHKLGSQAAEDFKTVDKALSELVKGGGATQARIAFEQLAAKWEAAGGKLSDLRELFPEYAKAAGEASSANSAMARGFGDSAANARTLAAGLEEAMRAGQTVLDVFNQLNGANLSLSDAQIKAESAARSLSEALQESGGSMDITTEKGSRARQSANDLARAAADVTQKTYEQTGSLAAARNAFDQYIGRLAATLRQAGWTEAAIAGLIGQIGQMPPLVTTAVQAVGLTEVTDQMSVYKRLLTDVHGKTYVSRMVTVYENQGRPGGNSLNYVANADGGIVEYYAGGGLRERHLAQIAPAGTMRVWNEPETGGEAYIPLSPAKRDRSLAIWSEVGRRLGVSAMGVVMPMAGAMAARAQTPSPPSPAGDRALLQIGQFHAHAAQSPRDVAVEVDWLIRTRG
jgi:TP901 family phage tail tape measure protein